MAMGGVGVRQYQKPVGGSLVPDFPTEAERYRCPQSRRFAIRRPRSLGGTLYSTIAALIAASSSG